MVQKVRVTATRLPDLPEEASRIPAHVTVYTRDQIAASGSVTIQDFLALQSDFVVFDEVGNGVEATAELRGFNTGSLATAALVTVDGVRVNEPDTGYVNFELLPLEEIERIEVVRGSSSALFGEGGLGGAIHVVTRRGTDNGRAVGRVEGGSFDTRGFAASSGGTAGRFAWRGAFSRRLSEGFRENSDTRLSAFHGNLDWTLSDRQSLGFDLFAGTNRLNQPGALTRDELEQDREQNPFNARDFSATDHALPSLRYQLRTGAGFSITSRLSLRDADETSFVGGRSGLGSTSEIDRRGVSWTVQAAREHGGAGQAGRLVFGAEVALDRFETGGTRTDPEGDPLPQTDFSYSASEAASTRRFAALFAQETLALGPRWSLTGGIRADRIRLYSSGRQSFYDFPPPDFTPTFTERRVGGEREFTEVSPKLGVNFNPSEKNAWYAGYSRGFRAPTVVELFAFPIFFSNADLEPVVSDDFEAGWSGSLGGPVTASVHAFWIDLRDEIFFVLTDPSSFTGRNLNLPRTRRRGAVVSVGSQLARWLHAEASATLTDATFRTEFEDANIGNRVEEGDRLPQIPREKYALKVESPLPGGWRVSLQEIYVGAQPLTSDLANVAPRLDPYNLLNARVAWTRGDWTAFLQANNILDRGYSTRGIYAFDFSSFAFEEFFTPAPGFHFRIGVEARF
jgi:iron complex outermembrane receptor protein